MLKIRILYSDLVEILNKINNSEINSDNISRELNIKNIKIKKNKSKNVKICRSVLYISDSSDSDSDID